MLTDGKCCGKNLRLLGFACLVASTLASCKLAGGSSLADDSMQPDCSSADSNCTLGDAVVTPVPTTDAMKAEVDQACDQDSASLSLTTANNMTTTVNGATGVATTSPPSGGTPGANAAAADLGVIQSFLNVAENFINFLGSNDGTIVQTPGFFTAVPPGTRSFSDITTWESTPHYKSLQFSWPAFSVGNLNAGTAASFVVTLKWEASGADGSYPRSLWVSIYPEQVHVKNKTNVTGTARVDFSGLASSGTPGQAIGQVSVHFTMTVTTLFAGVSTKDVSCTVTANMSPDFVNEQGFADNPDAVCN